MEFRASQIVKGRHFTESGLHRLETYLVENRLEREGIERLDLSKKHDDVDEDE